MTEGGLSLSAGVSNIDIDLTKPTVTYSGGKARYGVEETVSITCTAADALLGHRVLDMREHQWPCRLVRAGRAHVLRSALDNAGNTGSGSVSFEVVVTFTGLCDLTRQYADKPTIADSLCAKLAAAGAKATARSAGRPARVREPGRSAIRQDVHGGGGGDARLPRRSSLELHRDNG